MKPTGIEASGCWWEEYQAAKSEAASLRQEVGMSARMLKVALARLNAIDGCVQCPACDKHAKAALADIDRIAKEKNEP